MNHNLSKKLSFETISIHGGEDPRKNRGAISTPIYQTSTFAFEDTESLLAVRRGDKEGFTYTRRSNPTIRVAEEKLSLLEECEDAIVVSSGMAAISVSILSAVSAGDNIVSIRDLYGGAVNFFNNFLPKLNISVSRAASTDASEIESLIKKNTKLIYIETPTNPTLRLIDIEKVARIGKSRGIITIIDNTFATPFNQRPARMGIDVIIHSATKYLNGHSDLIAGAIIGSKEFIKKARDSRSAYGCILDPFGAWLLIRGLWTLPLRMERHNINALRVAEFLESHPDVVKVNYPGLKSHPQHFLSKKQMRGFGGMLSFEVRGEGDAAQRVVDSTKICSIGASLGGCETIISQPVYTSHSGVPAEERLDMGIKDNLIRLSVGLENVEDIIEDLNQSLSRI